MSLAALGFREWFDGLPFGDGSEVCVSCDRPALTETGREIVDAVDGLISVTCHVCLVSRIAADAAPAVSRRRTICSFSGPLSLRWKNMMIRSAPRERLAGAGR